MTGNAAICIVSYNTRELLRACLDAIQHQGARETVVVDNASADGSAEMLQREFPWVRAILNQQNAGYAVAVNQAIRATSAPAAFLLNADTVPAPDALRRLLAYRARHPEAAVIGPRIVNLDGSLQPSCYPEPTPLQLLLDSSGLSRVMPRLPLVRDLSLRWWRHDRPRRVPWLLGAALLIERDVFDSLDGFDERFPLYYEETDFCRRVREAGWQVQFAPVTTVHHAGGASSSGRPKEALRRWEQGVRIYYKKHYGPVRQAQLEATLASIRLARQTRQRLSS